MPTEKEKMMAGELYQAFDSELLRERQEAKRLCFEFNQTCPTDERKRKAILEQLLPHSMHHEDGACWVESPFHCDYGYNVKTGRNFYANHGCTILDCNEVSIGNNCMLAPHVCISAATHPVDAERRAAGDEFSAAISIGNNVWIGANSTICAGVSIGDNVVVGAGAVVNKTIPTNVVCGGAPAKIIRRLE